MLHESIYQGLKRRRQPDLHRRIAVLQTAALLLGYAATVVLPKKDL
jgi:hypothetical protein